MDGRKRTVQIKFRVTEAERDLILEKMKLVPTRNMAAYLRKIAIDGYIIQIDHCYLSCSFCGSKRCIQLHRFVLLKLPHFLFPSAYYAVGKFF